mgnify:CR=1 FL=1
MYGVGGTRTGMDWTYAGGVWPARLVITGTYLTREFRRTQLLPSGPASLRLKIGGFGQSFLAVSWQTFKDSAAEDLRSAHWHRPPAPSQSFQLAAQSCLRSPAVSCLLCCAGALNLTALWTERHCVDLIWVAHDRTGLSSRRLPRRNGWRLSQRGSKRLHYRSLSSIWMRSRDRQRRRYLKDNDEQHRHLQRPAQLRPEQTDHLRNTCDDALLQGEEVHLCMVLVSPPSADLPSVPAHELAPSQGSPTRA